VVVAFGSLLYIQNATSAIVQFPSLQPLRGIVPSQSSSSTVHGLRPRAASLVVVVAGRLQPLVSACRPAMSAAFKAFLNSPVGPKTTHFWGPVSNWGIILAVRPAHALWSSSLRLMREFPAPDRESSLSLSLSLSLSRHELSC